MQDADIDPLVTRITGGETPRVWSLLVTVFGELAQAPGARIGGALLTRLTEPVGVRPEAARVALHRLRKDGWIVSHRNGRASDHMLTDWGRRQSAAASPRIYAADPLAQAAWLVLSDPARSADPAAPGIAVAAHVDIAAHHPGDADAFVVPLPPGAPLPEWMTARICPPETVAQAAALAARLEDLTAALPDPAGLSALHIAVLRVLIVHSWRRIVLRLPSLPDHVFPTGWQGPACRAMASGLLVRLPRQTLDGLSREDA